MPDLTVTKSHSGSFSQGQSGAQYSITVTNSGPNAVPDYAPPVQMNHFIWYQTNGWTKPYPGESKIYAPDQVPGAYIQSFTALAQLHATGTAGAGVWHHHHPRPGSR